jgi:hypothetical protein
VSDQWYYLHAQAVHGPVSGDELRRLVGTGGLLPEDLVWPVGWDPLNGIPAEGALKFPEPLPVNPVGPGPAPPLPQWLPDLAKALSAGDDPAALPIPSAETWLADIRSAENLPQRDEE